MEHTILISIITIAIATLFNVILKKIKIPTIIGYILSGFIVSILFHFDKSDKISLAHIAEFGIVFLMFTIGLEFSAKHFRAMKKEVFIYGGLQVMASGVIFSILSYYIIEASIKSALVIGFALSLSSTAIVLKILNERRETHSGYGRATLGILLFQDLAVIPILIMISIFTSHNQSFGEIAFNMVISGIVVFVTFFILGKYITDRYFRWIMKANSEEIFLVSVLLIVISTAYFVEFVGFSYSLGAFLAGMMLSETRYRYKIESDLIPFRDILLGLFFITIGMQIDWHMIVEHWQMILAIIFVVVTTKALIIYSIISFMSQKRTAIKSALALFEVGEFALVIFTLAASTNMISPTVSQVFIISVIATMIIAPFIIKNMKSITDYFLPEPTDLRQRAFKKDGFLNHIIICGYGPIGKAISSNLENNNINYIVLEHDIAVVDKAIATGEHDIFFANAARKSVLEHFNAINSLAIIIAITNEKQRMLICENIMSLGDDINTIVTVNNAEEERIMMDIGIKNIVNDRELISDILTQKALSCSLGATKSPIDLKAKISSI
jgi:CPA2 family monovalent cation:H+ antiporter-2